MSFFKKLFGKKENPKPPAEEENSPLKESKPSPTPTPPSTITSQEKKEPIPQTDPEIEKFEEEVKTAFPRYFSNPEMGDDININLHNEVGEEIPMHMAFPEQFEEWKKIQSPWDRLGLIFRIFDHMFGQKLELWQAMNRFTEGRYPQRAIELAEEHSTEYDWEDANYWYALGRAQFILSREELAEASLKKCLEFDPTHKRGRTTFADLLHETNRQDEAHLMYTEIIKESGIQGNGVTPVSISMAELLGFKGIIHSPVYAIAVLTGHDDTTEETWERASAAFYYSPHFRTRHAYHMIHENKNVQALAKLYSLSREMPWFEEAVINAYSIIDQLGLSEKMVEERTWLKSVMDQNDWSI